MLHRLLKMVAIILLTNSSQIWAALPERTRVNSSKIITQQQLRTVDAAQWLERSMIRATLAVLKKRQQLQITTTETHIGHMSQPYRQTNTWMNLISLSTVENCQRSWKPSITDPGVPPRKCPNQPESTIATTATTCEISLAVAAVIAETVVNLIESTVQHSWAVM